MLNVLLIFPQLQIPRQIYRRNLRQTYLLSRLQRLLIIRSNRRLKHLRQPQQQLLKILIQPDPIQMKLLLLLKLKHSIHRKLKRKPLHQSLQHLHQHVNQLDLQNNDLFVLNSIEDREVELRGGRVDKDVHVMIDGCGELGLQEILKHLLKSQKGDVFKSHRFGLQHVRNHALRNGAVEEFDELEDLGVEPLLEDLELFHCLVLGGDNVREELGDEEPPLLDVGVLGGELQFNLNVVVLVEGVAEAIAFERLSVA